ncbi:MAG: hypothetical protein EOP11_09685 [Proteobacteria bacterium]|nr:MAG: hypothetical protein EOP11_09685 [Pseudomonadota bacterium]
MKLIKVRWISLLLLFALAVGAPYLAPGFAFAADDDSSASETKEEDARTVAIGNLEVIDLDFDVGDAIPGNAPVLSIEKTGTRSIRINPVKAGTSNVLIYNTQRKLMRRLQYNVVKSDASAKVLAIRKLLYDIEGITVELVDDKIVIDGDLVVPRDLDRIVQVTSAYPEVLNLVTLSRISREALARRMQKEINDDPGGVNVTVRIINDTFFLLGKVDNTPDKERAETLASTFIPDLMKGASGEMLTQPVKRFAIRNLIVTEEAPPAPPPKMVRVTYHFVEIGKDFLKSSLFKWNPMLGDSSGIQIGQGTAGATAASGTFSGLISNLLPKLQSGANGGFSRVLFSTVQVGETGKTLELVRGDSIPYIAATINGIPQPDNVNANISITVTPNIVGEDQVSLESQFGFTALTGAGAGGKPATKSTNMKNTIRVKTGESTVLGGLISSQASKDIDRDPDQPAAAAGGGAAPSPIFTLLRSKAFRQSKTQFVVFVTPKILEDASSGTADIKAKILNNSQKKRRRVIN